MCDGDGGGGLVSLFVGGHGVWSYGYRIIGWVCGWEHYEREKSVFGCKFL